ncbi:hypothetical protein KVR01_006484 [Diaporthe batatas]|uniref:uncharacterized protein n=1 Tax=Diaporthe batatas TaxID=748121 RepID=UPI001D053862|nr:uncharacterized protein KVR01_006484 [Diaporthe batatas]KAG8164566.1 hypothetical protein KVR01_006484 [Diaporthe batatas]
MTTLLPLQNIRSSRCVSIVLEPQAPIGQLGLALCPFPFLPKLLIRFYHRAPPVLTAPADRQVLPLVANMSNPNALFLLADHIKLSLLERKRAQALNLQSDSQDGHLSRSLDQFRDGLEALQTEQQRLHEAGDDAKAATIADSLPGLQKQFDDLTSQFHGFSAPSSNSTLTQPNDPALAADFAHASNTSTSPPLASSSSRQAPAKKSLRSSSGTSTPTGGSSKTVRFQDNSNSNASASASNSADDDAAAARLFNQPYRDDPDGPEGYRDTAEGLADNVQVHAYHSRILREQDDQLDRLGESISRQRELSMQIGDELDDQVAMLEDQEALVDRHASRLDRARRQVGRIARSAGESKQMIAIIVLIVILVLLIAVLK